MTHTEIYANVIKARPECAVVRGPHKLAPHVDVGWFAWLSGSSQHCDEPCRPEDAPALITDHWTEMLPDGCFLCPCDGIHTDNRVWYIDKFNDAPHPLPTYHPTRFHALAEFLVPGSTKEKA